MLYTRDSKTIAALCFNKEGTEGIKVSIIVAGQVFELFNRKGAKAQGRKDVLCNSFRTGFIPTE